MKKGGRAKEFELAIQWLVDAGLVYKITKVTKPELPLKFYEDLSAFKLYLCDCGLMGGYDLNSYNINILTSALPIFSILFMGCRK